MRMKKRIVSLALAAGVLLFSFAGCSSSSTESVSSESDETEFSSSSESEEKDEWYYGYLTGIDDASPSGASDGYSTGEDAAVSIDYFSFDSTSDSRYDVGYQEAYNKYYRRSFLKGYIEGYISICDEINLDDLFEEISDDIYG